MGAVAAELFEKRQPTQGGADPAFPAARNRPFLCRGDNGLLYYVKGQGAGRKALISEWIAGTLAKRLGLLIRDFARATIPGAIISA